MSTFLLILQLVFAVVLIGVVLMQKSEGGALGIGGGGGFMTARGATNFLTRVTAIIAALFMASSLGLSLLARHGNQGTSLLDRIPVSTTPAKTRPRKTDATTSVPAAPKASDADAKLKEDPSPASIPAPAVPMAPAAPTAPSAPVTKAPAGSSTGN